MKLFSPVMLIATLLFNLIAVPTWAGKNKTELPKISQPGVYQGYTSADYNGFKYTSFYIKTRDSILLAADVYLPKHLQKGKKVPTILYLTRYVRSIQAKAPFNLLMDPIFGDIGESEIKFFTSYGYACVVVDARGTGASTGKRRMEFSPEEVADGKDIVDWIIAQNWSDGNVGTTGVSYVGTTAELLLANMHPNVKASIPRCNIFDLYNNMVFPGGVCQGDFINVWGATTVYLDQNNFQPFTNKYKMLLGIHPVKGDKGKKIWKEAVALHKNNFDVSTGIDQIKFRDDIQGNINASLNDFSIHNLRAKIEASKTPIYRIDGWYDGALGKGCIDDWQNTSNTKKVLLGPWDHGPHNNVSPFAKSKNVNYHLKAEMLRFFDHYLKNVDNGIDKEPVLNYFTVGEEKWHTANTWPPQNKTTSLYLSTNSSLVSTANQITGGTVNYNVDYTTTTGPTTRWNSLTDGFRHGPSDYPDRRKEDEKLLCFTSPKLDKPTEITGNPVVHLNFAANADDATVFCYLEDVAPDSSVTYITEGMFRPMQRKICAAGPYKTCYPNHSYLKADCEPYKANSTVELVFDLLPISYLLPAGHQLRLSVAGADVGHFTAPDIKPTEFKISSSAATASYVELPMVER